MNVEQDMNHEEPIDYAAQETEWGITGAASGHRTVGQDVKTEEGAAHETVRMSQSSGSRTAVGGLVGAVIGAALGGYLGSSASEKDEGDARAVIGSLVGAVIGGLIGDMVSLSGDPRGDPIQGDPPTDPSPPSERKKPSFGQASQNKPGGASAGKEEGKGKG